MSAPGKSVKFHRQWFAEGALGTYIRTMHHSSISPWLSVIMPTFNGARFLSTALASLEQQGSKDFEIIAIDDGSTDETLEILHTFKSRLPLRTLSVSHQGNWVTNTNLAIREAKGTHCTFLHQDDAWISGRLRVARSLFEMHPEAVLLLHPSWYIDDSGRRLGRWGCPFPSNTTSLNPSYIFERLIVQNFISIPGPIFKRQAALAVGLLNESLWFTADWLFWLKLSQQGDWIYHPQPLTEFRVHAQSQTATQAAKSQAYREQFESVLREFSPVLEHRRDLHRLASYSVECNIALAQMYQRQFSHISTVLLDTIKLGPFGFAKYIKYSRVHERVGSRLRAHFRSRDLGGEQRTRQ